MLYFFEEFLVSGGFFVLVCDLWFCLIFIIEIYCFFIFLVCMGKIKVWFMFLMVLNDVYVKRKFRVVIFVLIIK